MLLLVTVLYALILRVVWLGGYRKGYQDAMLWRKNNVTE